MSGLIAHQHPGSRLDMCLNTMALVDDVENLLSSSPEVKSILGLIEFSNFAELAGGLFASLSNNAEVGKSVMEVYASDSALVKLTTYDVHESARRNFEPGGPAAALLYSRGVHAVMAHRVAHKLWNEGKTNIAYALKTACGRALGTDIHPAAKIGAGLWLDHGLGFVVGETCVIENDVSIWHNVTLGSTLSDSGVTRHPHIGHGVVIGAGAVVLGDITIGEHANIGAGAIVVNDVPARSLVVGSKAVKRGTARISFIEAEQS